MIVLMFTIVVLLFVTVLGLGLRTAGLVPDKLKNLLHKYVYYIAVPAAIIYSLSGQLNIDINTYATFLGANLAAYLGIFIATSIYARWTKLHYKQAGVFRFSSNASNTVFLGFPLVIILFDHAYFIYAVILGSLVDTILNTIKVSLIQSSTKQKQGSWRTRLLLSNFINPLVVALLVALLLAIANIHLPTVAHTIIGVVGKTSSYVALFVLGTSLYGLQVAKKDYRILAAITTIKLVALPLVMLLICMVAGLSPQARDISVILSAMPVAVFSLIVADNLKLEEQLAAGAILVTTCLAPLSLLGWLVVLRQL